MIAHDWPWVLAEYGASRVACAPEDEGRLRSELAAAQEGALLTLDEATTLAAALYTDAALSGLHIVEYRTDAGAVVGRAKAE